MKSLRLPFGRAHGAAPGALVFLLAPLVFGRPTPAVAQTVTRDQVVGWWKVKGEEKPRLALRADSTATIFDVRAGSKVGVIEAHWSLIGDTLLMNRTRAKIPGQPAAAPPKIRRLVTFKDQQLTLTKVDPPAQGEEGPESVDYERTDSLKAGSPN